MILSVEGTVGHEEASGLPYESLELCFREGRGTGERSEKRRNARKFSISSESVRRTWNVERRVVVSGRGRCDGGGG